MAQLGKYELHEQIGKGGFGTVYRATDNSLGRLVALKILHPQMAADAEFVERFRKEARLAAAMENPHVVTIYEVGEQDGRYFIAMRYYPGGSLADLLKQAPLPWSKTSAILTQVCEGLHLLHAQGWVHRDLKPSNILFDTQGRAVVADFGLARALIASGSSSSGGMGAGTPHYKAPELWRGKPPASPATDVYALGCILGEMISGQLLFPGETPDEVMTRHVLDGPDFGENWPPPTIPERVQEALMRALERDPERRFPDATAFWKALSRTEEIAPRSSHGAGESDIKNALSLEQKVTGFQIHNFDLRHPDPPTAKARGLPWYAWVELFLIFGFGALGIWMVTMGLLESRSGNAEGGLLIVLGFIFVIPLSLLSFFFIQGKYQNRK